MIINREFIIKTIILIGSIWLSLLLSFTPVDNPDFGFHLRTGQDIIEKHHFPMIESYSYTAKGNFNSMYSWIFDCLCYISYQFWDNNGLIYLQVIFVLAIFLIIIINLFRSDLLKQNMPLSLLVAVNIILAFAFLIMPRIMIRPHLMGFALFAWFVIIFEDIEKNQNKETGLKNFLKDKHVWLAMAIFVFWVNSHSSFAEVYVLLAIWIFSNILKQYTDQKKNKRIVNIISLSLIFIFLSFCSPNFARIYEMLFTPAKYPAEEYFSIFEILPKSGYFYIGIIIIYVICFGAAAVHYFRKKDFYRSFTMIFFIVIAVYSVRFLGELGIIAGIMSQPALISLIKFAEQKAKIKKILIIGIFLIAIGQSALIYYYHQPIGFGLNKSSFPIYSAKYMDNQDLEGKMFNSFEWGGYLIWALQKYPVFIDGRGQLYTNKFINDFRTKILQKPPVYFYEQCRKYGISFAVVPYASNIGNIIVNDYSGYLFNNSDWALVYFDNNSLVYIKRGFSKKNDSIIARDEYSMLQPTIMAPPLLDKYLNNNLLQQKLIKELQRSISERPDCIYSHFCLAYVRFKTGDFTEAIRELEITRKLYPNPQVEMLYQQLKKM